MNPESINNLNHVKKILSLEFDKLMPLQNKNKAYRDAYVNLINIIDLLRINIEIYNSPDKYLEKDKKQHLGEKYDGK